MSFFFKGAVTSSPVKTRRQEAEYICHSLDVSHISDSSFECFSTNPLTGYVCVCRRSPRLLASGYYVLTEDSFTTDDEGNVTLTPSHTSVSYKENLVRIFRRKHRARKSPASLLNDVNQPCHSWLEEGVFRRSDPIVPLRSSPWEELDNSYETNTSVSFTYVPTDLVSSPDKMPPQTQLEEEEPPCESCSAHEQSNQSVSGLLDVPPPSMCHLNSYSSSSKTSETVLLKVLLLILTLCLCIAISSGWLLGGVSAAVAFMVLLSSICMSKPGAAVRWSRAKTEDITSRNE